MCVYRDMHIWYALGIRIATAIAKASSCLHHLTYVRVLASCMLDAVYVGYSYVVRICLPKEIEFRGACVEKINWF